MKRWRLLLACSALSGAGLGAAWAAGGAGPEFMPRDIKAPTVDSTSDAQLDELRAAAKQKSEAVPGKEAPPGFDLVDLSTFIADGAEYTLVPKNAVIFVPEARAANIISQPGKEYVTWGTFLTTRRAWVTTYEVTLQQARGETPITPEQMEKFKKGNMIVVATFRGGPISVLPHKAKGDAEVATSKPAQP